MLQLPSFAARVRTKLPGPLFIVPPLGLGGEFPAFAF